MYAFLADLVTALHLSIVLFMIGGLVLVIVGWPLRWKWIRNPWFRFTHLGIMVYIAQNAIDGELCFLTHVEHDLREKAGQLQAGGEPISFIGKALREGLYVENVDQDVLHVIYLVFGVMVLVSVLFVRPRWFGSKPKPDAAPEA